MGYSISPYVPPANLVQAAAFYIQVYGLNSPPRTIEAFRLATPNRYGFRRDAFGVAPEDPATGPYPGSGPWTTPSASLVRAGSVLLPVWLLDERTPHYGRVTLGTPP